MRDCQGSGVRGQRSEISKNARRQPVARLTAESRRLRRMSTWAALSPILPAAIAT